MTRRASAGAALLMATSAVGPGFLTQTALFTGRLGADLGFAIAASVVLDVAAQLMIWRVVVATGLRAPSLADGVRRGLGTVLVVLVAVGGLAFNLGNVAGAGLGLEALAGLDPRAGALGSALLAALLFVRPAARAWLDRAALALGAALVASLGAVALTADVDLGLVARRTVLPAHIDVRVILTLVGGTVGGYIPFAGAHRLLDAGIHGPMAVATATRAAVAGLAVATVLRLALFVAALGAAAAGAAPDDANPAAGVFEAVAGPGGRAAFGLAMWAAAMTSILGSAYTTLSFVGDRLPEVERHRDRWAAVFVLVTAVAFGVAGRPVTLLVLAGLLNGAVLPLALGACVAASTRATTSVARQPPWVTVPAAAVVVLMAIAALLAAREGVGALTRGA